MLNSSLSAIELIKNLSQDAGLLLMDFYRKGFAVSRKRDDSFVTDADIASERLILSRINSMFPDDKTYSEEAGLSSEDRKAGSYIWIIDPLDGTTNFANHYDFFCVSIARGRFTSEGTIVIEAGAVHDPLRGKTYAASLGQGATVNDKELRVTSCRALKDAFLATGFYYNSGVNLKQDIMRLYEVANCCNGIRRDGAAALDMALVAEGVYDGFWEWGLKPWDVAAGQLLIMEAGGVVMNYPDPSQTAFDVEKPGVICGAKPIVESLAKIMVPK